jgi:hypothetical protein
MKVKCFNNITKVYESVELPVTEKENKFKILRSMIPKSLLTRSPNLIYIVEFLKCDGCVYITKRKDGFAGEVIFTTTNQSYKTILKKIVEKTFNSLKPFNRNDGFGISNLSLSVLLAEKFDIPVGKKGEMETVVPENLEEAQMVLRAVIDAEGNVDDYGGSIVIGNQSKKYLETYKEVLEKWFEITCVDLSPTKGWGEKTNRIAITKDSDLVKVFNIGLFNPAKQARLKFIVDSLKKYREEKSALLEKVKFILKEPKTIRQVSDTLNLAPFVVRRLINSLKAIKVGKIKKNNRCQVLWMLK